MPEGRERLRRAAIRVCPCGCRQPRVRVPRWLRDDGRRQDVHDDPGVQVVAVHERLDVRGRRVHVRGVPDAVVVRVRSGLGGVAVRGEPGRVLVVPMCKWGDLRGRGARVLVRVQRRVRRLQLRC